MIKLENAMSYLELCDYKTLSKAHDVAAKGKRHKTSVIKFELNRYSFLAHLQEKLLSKSYKLKPYFKFYVREPKPRTIYALEYVDRVVQHALCDNILEPYFTRLVIYDNAGCVRGRGQHFAVKRLKKFLKSHYHTYGEKGYFLKVDIKKYFFSLSHEVIKQNMSSHLIDPDVKNLFNLIVDSFNTDESFLLENGIQTHDASGNRVARGVPIGNQTSQIIGMFYLNAVDRFIKEQLKIKHYIRYMDDFVLVHHDKKTLQEMLELIKEFLCDKLKLQVNKKTQISPIKNGITFLGHRIMVSEQGKVINYIVAKTLQRFRKAVRKFNKSAFREVLKNNRNHDLPTVSLNQSKADIQKALLPYKKLQYAEMAEDNILFPPEYSPDKIKQTVQSCLGHCKHSSSRGKSKQIAKRLFVSTATYTAAQKLKQLQKLQDPVVKVDLRTPISKSKDYKYWCRKKSKKINRKVKQKSVQLSMFD